MDGGLARFDAFPRGPVGLWRRLAACALALLLLPALSLARSYPEPARIQGELQRLDLAPHTSYRVQYEQDLEATRLFEIADNGGFDRVPGNAPVVGFHAQPHWFQVRLQNIDADLSRWLLVVDYALLDHIELYLRDADGKVTRMASGDRLPFAERAIAHRHPNFWVDLPSGRWADLLVRVQSESSLQVPLILWRPQAFEQHERDAQLGVGLYYGILLALLLYNLVLFVSLRDRSYLYYVLHISAFGAVMLSVNGLAFQYFWPGSPWLANLAVPLSIALGLIAMLQFARHYLELKRLVPLGARLSGWLMLAMAVLAALTPLLPYRPAVLIGTASVFPGIAIVLTSAVLAARRGYLPARWFLLAWSILLLGTLVYAMVSFGLLPKTFVTEYGIQIGSALEMVLLSFALAYRYAALRNENERIVKDARDQLESRVEKRTQELSSALTQLSEANGRLREFNRRDGLTGVFNRRHFEEELLREFADARQQGRALSLVMADIDHFKAINDTHGHLVGDDCLRWVARQMEEAVAPERGIVARYGGEEFAIVLPHLDVDRAVQVAERLRRRVSAAPFVGDACVVGVTLSLGVTELGGASDVTPADAMRRADRALYSAKQCGRNRVQRLVEAG